MGGGDALRGPQLKAGNSPTPAQGGLQLTNGGQAIGAMFQAMPYLGFAAALRQSIMCRLKWQRDIAGDTQKIKQFQEVVVGLQDFRMYLLVHQARERICDNPPFPMTFMAIRKATQHLQGHFVSFVGDCMVTKDSTPLIVLQQKHRNGRQKQVALTPRCLIPTTQMIFPSRESCEPRTTPRVTWEWKYRPCSSLSIPLILFSAIQEEGRPLMPHKVRNCANTIISKAGDLNELLDDWDLILSWCLMASHQDTNISFVCECSD